MPCKSNTLISNLGCAQRCLCWCSTISSHSSKSWEMQCKGSMQASAAPDTMWQLNMIILPCSPTWHICTVLCCAMWTRQMSSVLAWGTLHHVLCSLNVPLEMKLICLTCRGENASWLASVGLIKWDYWKTKICQSVQWFCRQQYLGRHWQAAPFEHPVFCSVKSSRLFFAGCDTCNSRDQQLRSCSQEDAVSGQELPLSTGQGGERFWSQRSSHHISLSGRQTDNLI